MAKQKFKTTNWKTYNDALRQRGSLTFWLSDDAVAAWYEEMINVPLCCPDYTSISKRFRSLNVNIMTPRRGEMAHVVIDSTGLKLFGEGEWKVKNHGAAKRRKWCTVHLAIDAVTYEIVCADSLLNNVTDAQALPGLMSQTDREIKEALAEGAYNVRDCHYTLEINEIKLVIPPRSSAKYWLPSMYPERNQAVEHQLLTGNNEAWKDKVGYHRRSLAETAISRIKKVFAGG